MLSLIFWPFEFLKGFIMRFTAWRFLDNIFRLNIWAHYFAISLNNLFLTEGTIFSISYADIRIRGYELLIRKEIIFGTLAPNSVPDIAGKYVGVLRTFPRFFNLRTRANSVDSNSFSIAIIVHRMYMDP